jgi:hypothetical protein
MNKSSLRLLLLASSVLCPSVAFGISLPPDANGVVATGSTTYRSFATRAADGINVKDYGARGDGSTDDTAAISAAFTAAASAKKDVYLPAGIYSVTCLTYTSASYTSQFSIYGEGRNLTNIKQTAAQVCPVLVIGDSAATNYMANIWLRGITFTAFSNTSPSAVTSYNLVRSRFDDVLVTGAAVGYLQNGGISDTLNLDAISNGIGVKLVNFSGSAAGNYPNNIRLSGVFATNATYGLWVDGGTQIECDACDIEGNGTVLGAASGGVYVGPNIGLEFGLSLPSTGLTLRNGWFEQNMGDADVQFNSGRNAIHDTWFYSQAAQTTYDVHINLGNYTVTNTQSAFTKTSNIKDEAAVNTGNTLWGGFFPNPNLSRVSVLETVNAFILSIAATMGNGLQVTGGNFTATRPLADQSETLLTSGGSSTVGANVGRIVMDGVNATYTLTTAAAPIDGQPLTNATV